MNTKTYKAIENLQQTARTMVVDLEVLQNRVDNKETALENEITELKRRIKEVRSERDVLSETDGLEALKESRDEWKYLAGEHEENARALRVELDAAKKDRDTARAERDKLEPVEDDRDDWKAIVHECEELVYKTLGKAPPSSKASFSLLPLRIRELKARTESAEAEVESLKKEVEARELTKHFDRSEAASIEADREAWRSLVQESRILLGLDLRKSPGADCNALTNAIKALRNERYDLRDQINALKKERDKWQAIAYVKEGNQKHPSSICPFAPEFVLPAIVKQAKEAIDQKEAPKTPPGSTCPFARGYEIGFDPAVPGSDKTVVAKVPPPGFTCPKCGSKTWGTVNALSPGAYGYCTGQAHGGPQCDFTWLRADDEKYGVDPLSGPQK